MLKLDLLVLPIGNSAATELDMHLSNALSCWVCLPSLIISSTPASLLQNIIEIYWYWLCV